MEPAQYGGTWCNRSYGGISFSGKEYNNNDQSFLNIVQYPPPVAAADTIQFGGALTFVMVFYLD